MPKCLQELGFRPDGAVKGTYLRDEIGGTAHPRYQARRRRSPSGLKAGRSGNLTEYLDQLYSTARVKMGRSKLWNVVYVSLAEELL